jgi:hypothetical protein
MGIWGSAAILPEYEVQPEERLAPLLYLLAIREVGEARWTNVFQVEACPWGAGMFVRRQVADAYREASRGERIKITGRLGESLMSGEDVELSYMACDLGLGIGIFPELIITHLIPGGRVREEYLLRLYEGIHISNYLILYKWKNIPPRATYTLRQIISIARKFFFLRGIDRKTYFGKLRAEKKACNIVQSLLPAFHKG